MNKLYEAIIALDRSIRDFRLHGWMTGDFGDCESSPKCAIGAFSHAMVGHTCDPAEPWFPLMYPMQAMTSRVGAIALWESLTDSQREILGSACGALDRDGCPGYMGRAFKVASEGNAKTDQYINLVVVANDQAMQSQEEVVHWFSDAIDLLAEQLPVPPGPLFPAARQNSVELALA